MTRRLGRYELLGKIAEGGMAEVFLARQSGPMGFSKLVVIKRILPALAVDEKFVRMFLDEARLAALVNHPNVVSIHELAEDPDDETVYMAMEYIDGVTLKRLCEELRARRERIRLPLGLRILADACAGLDFAHNLKSPAGEPLRFVHRDVSPENILITFSGQVKVVDFGIAKAAASQERTRMGEFKGKLSYASPEHARGQPIDRRADVWALGVTLYWMIAGRRPFRAERPLELMRRIVQDEPPPLRQYAPHLPAEVEAIVARALAKSADERFQSARALQEAMEAWIRSSGEDAGSTRLSDYMNDLFPETSSPQRLRIRQLVAGEAADPFEAPQRMGTPVSPSGKLLEEPDSPTEATYEARPPSTDAEVTHRAAPPEEPVEVTARARPPELPSGHPPPGAARLEKAIARQPHPIDQATVPSVPVKAPEISLSLFDDLDLSTTKTNLVLRAENGPKSSPDDGRTNSPDDVDDLFPPPRRKRLWAGIGLGLAALAIGLLLAHRAFPHRRPSSPAVEPSLLPPMAAKPAQEAPPRAVAGQPAAPAPASPEPATPAPPASPPSEGSPAAAPSPPS